MGYALFHGRGVRKDARKGVEHYRRAAIAGDRIAQWNLGCCYKDGTGVKRSTRNSNHWMRKARAQGHRAARTFLAQVASKR